MTTLKTILILLGLTLYSWSLAQAPSRKFALLIGIDQYQNPNVYAPLQVQNGLSILQQTLLNQGFEPENILLLTHDQATRQGILSAFESHLGQASAGDIAVFHFTGHGTQLIDDGADEVDKLDEAIVPYDGKLILDDELSERLDLLRQKLGTAGQVLVLLDACNAGGGIRGKRNLKKPERNTLLEGISPTDESKKAPLIAFYASMPNEKSIQINGADGRPYGPLTYAFCEAMQSVDSKTTYRGLFDHITWKMTAHCTKHTPQREGNPDLLLFGGRVQTPPLYFTALTVIDKHRARVKGGLLNGLQAGTEVVLYAVDTRDTVGVPLLALGTIDEMKAGLTECNLTLDAPLPEKEFKLAWIFIRQRSFVGYNLKIRLNIENTELRQATQKCLSSLPILQQDEIYPDLLLFQLAENQVELRGVDSSLLLKTFLIGKNAEAGAIALANAIGNYAQAQFLRGLTFEGSDYQADFTIRNENEPIINLHNAEPVTLHKDQDIATIHVTNRSDRSIYYTILDIDAQNVVQVLLPGEDSNPAEYRLNPGEESRPHRVRFNSAGQEVLKLIVTPVPIDLRETIASRGRTQRGRSFFERLFAQSYLQGNTNRGPVGKYSGNEAGVETLIIQIE